MHIKHTKDTEWRKQIQASPPPISAIFRIIQAKFMKTLGTVILVMNFSYGVKPSIPLEIIFQFSSLIFKRDMLLIMSPSSIP